MRVHGVGVDDPGDLALPQEARGMRRQRVARVPHGRIEDEELHEEAAIARLPLAVLLPAVLVDVDGRQAWGGGTLRGGISGSHRAPLYVIPRRLGGSPQLRITRSLVSVISSMANLTPSLPRPESRVPP